MNYSIIAIGDELLIGQVTDTNSGWIARHLTPYGWNVKSVKVVADDAAEIFRAIDEAFEQTDVILMTGGLGPTKDDITKSSLAKITGATGFVVNQEQYAIMEAHLKARGIEISDINRDQALVPNNCIVLPNERGTAPNMEFILEKGEFGSKKLLFSLPGVPFEALAAIPKVIEAIKKEFPLEEIIHKTICTFGIPESTLAKIIEPWEDALPDNIHLAYLPNPILGVRLRLSIYGTESQSGTLAIEREIEALKGYIGDAIYGYGDTSLQETIGTLLMERGSTLATAESCTGGYVAHLITSISGSSNYFKGSVVSYHNSVKMNLLKVDEAILQNYGAVSRECVEQMAKGALEAVGADYAVAT